MSAVRDARVAASIVGLVLAGGRSVRFGSEKAVALFRGRPLLQWTAQRLVPIATSVAVNARPGTAAEALAGSLGLPVLHDAVGDANGPLAGVKAGLIWAEQQGAQALAVSPCDTPLLPADLYARLRDEGGAGAALAATSDGLQPLCALWPVTALPAVRDALEGGAHPPTWQVLEHLGARTVFFERAGDFASIDTRDDLAALEAGRCLLSGGTP